MSHVLFRDSSVALGVLCARDTPQLLGRCRARREKLMRVLHHVGPVLLAIDEQRWRRYVPHCSSGLTSRMSYPYMILVNHTRRGTRWRATLLRLAASRCIRALMSAKALSAISAPRPGSSVVAISTVEAPKQKPKSTILWEANPFCFK